MSSNCKNDRTSSRTRDSRDALEDMDETEIAAGGGVFEVLDLGTLLPCSLSPPGSTESATTSVSFSPSSTTSSAPPDEAAPAALEDSSHVDPYPGDEPPPIISSANRPFIPMYRNCTANACIMP